MPFKKKSDRKKYNKKYYQENRERLLEYRKTRREQDRKNWRAWYQRQKDKKRKEKIRTEEIYTNKSQNNKKSPYS